MSSSVVSEPFIEERVSVSRFRFPRIVRFDC